MKYHFMLCDKTSTFILKYWEYDNKNHYYRGSYGKKSKWSVQNLKVNHIIRHCSERFQFNIENIYIIYNDRCLKHNESLKKVCIDSGKFIHIVFLRDQDEIESMCFDVRETEKNSPQWCMEKSYKWNILFRELLKADVYGTEVANLAWQLLTIMPSSMIYGDILIKLIAEGIIPGIKYLSQDLAILISSFVPSTIQELYLKSI